MPRPAQAIVRISLDQAVGTLRQQVWSRLPNEAELEQMPLELETSAEELAAGSRPQVMFRDGRGRRYLFKLAPPDHIAAEIFAYRMRRVLRCLHVPTARRTETLPELGAQEGMIQPLIAHRNERLPPDPAQWHAVTTEYLLREHPWEWLLANLDTHVDQYVLVGPRRIPVNIDWDHALQDLAVTKLDRFNMRSATVAPIRNLFYSEYVAGKVEGDFYGMLLEARRIDVRLTDPLVERLTAQYCDELALEPGRRAETIEQVLGRKRSLPAAFDRFVADLELERSETLGVVPIQRSRAELMASRIQDAWQRMAITVLHDNVVRPGLKVYRSVLATGARVLKRPNQ